MYESPFVSCDDIVFRRPVVPFLVTICLIAGVGAMSWALAERASSILVLRIIFVLGIVIAIGFSIVYTYRYFVGAVIIRGFDLIILHGIFLIDEQVVPLSNPNIRNSQNLLDRMLDTGTITIPSGSEWYTVHIMHLQAFKRIVAQRRMNILLFSERMWHMNSYDA